MLRAELAFLFRRRRVQALLVALALVPVVITVSLRLFGGVEGGDGPTFLSQVTDNGFFAALAALTITVPVFLPMAATVVAADAVSGEAGLGTLRYLLVRPVGRTRLLAAKGVSVGVFCVVAALAVAAAGLVAGSILFPVGRITTLSGDTLPIATAMVRIVAAAGVVGLSLLGLAAVGFFVGTLTDASVGAIAATLGVLVLSGILGGIPQLASLHPWLFTDGWFAFGDLLRTDVTWSAIVRDLLLQAGYVVVFGTAAWARFTTRDVLG